MNSSLVGLAAVAVIRFGCFSLVLAVELFSLEWWPTYLDFFDDDFKDFGVAGRGLLLLWLFIQSPAIVAIYAFQTLLLAAVYTFYTPKALWRRLRHGRWEWL